MITNTKRKIYAICPECNTGKLISSDSPDEIGKIVLIRDERGRGKLKLKCPVCKRQIGLEIRNISQTLVKSAQ